MCHTQPVKTGTLEQQGGRCQSAEIVLDVQEHRLHDVLVSAIQTAALSSLQQGSNDGKTEITHAEHVKPSFLEQSAAQ